MLDQHFDVVIGGAGIVGAALAYSLSRLSIERPLSIALVEPKQVDPSTAVEQFDARVLALNESSRLLLDQLGIWRDLTGERICPYTHMEVRDSEGTGFIEFTCAEIQQENLGHIVEHSLVLNGLLAAIGGQANIELFCPDQIIAISRSDDNYQALQLANKTISTSLLIAADGSNSKLRTMCEFASRGWDYGHTAIVATLKGEKSHNYGAWQWFMPTGPLAFLPLQSSAGDNRYVSIVWSQSVDRSEALMAMGENEFCQALGLASEHCMGKVQLVSQRHSHPLHQCHAVDYVKPGVALIGDAAHTIHPLAGQGVNLGLQDVTVLTGELERALGRGLDIGDEAVLQRYQRRRKSENLAVMAMMEGFKRLFERDELPLRVLRNFGMNQFNNLAPLKNLLIKQAMGL
jgi:2-octaprenylphenol hydroxylase